MADQAGVEVYTEADREADTLREVWRELQRAHAAIRAEAEAVHGSTNRPALTVFAQRLHAHRARLRSFTLALERFHLRHGRSVGMEGTLAAAGAAEPPADRH